MTYPVSNAVLALNPAAAKEGLITLDGQVSGMAREPVKSKYHNQPELVDGQRFDSGKEAARYGELALLLRSGEIIALLCHRRLLVSPPDCQPIYYEPDFIYLDKNLTVHVEDVKPFDKKTGKFLTTRDYKLKRKLFEAKYGIKIEEV